MREYRFDFVGKRKIFICISIVLLLLAAVISFVRGVAVDIEFTGGYILTYSYQGDTVDLGEVKDVAEESLGESVTVRASSSQLTGLNNFIVSSSSNESLSTERHAALTAALQEHFGDLQVEAVDISNVDATMGRDFMLKSVCAVIFAAVLLIIYIAVRFKRISGWSAGVTAIICLIHDVGMVYATFVICNFALDANFMAVVLTIFGYSVNNTIIIFDRIRENRQAMGKRLNYPELVNKSVNQCLSRSINTTITTALAMVVICIVALICGVQSILYFAFPLLIGLLFGFYSSVFLAGPIWSFWKEKKGA